jgi:SAM-dependent methyltransferase
MTLAEICETLRQQGIFSGGPPQLFESAGRLQLATLVREGLYPYSRLLDVGCGCLRAGYWLIRLLDPGCYYGIEPNTKMLQAGIEQVMVRSSRLSKDPLSTLMTGTTSRFSGFSLTFSWHAPFGLTLQNRISRPCSTVSSSTPVPTPSF